MLISVITKAGKVKKVTVKRGNAKLIGGRSSGFGNRRMGNKGYSKRTEVQEGGTRKRNR